MESVKFRFILLVAFVLPLACGKGGPAGGPNIEVIEPWARAAPPMTEGAGASFNSAAYLLLRNTGATADRLLGGEASAAAAVELHESRLEDGVMRMRRVEGVEIPPGGEVALSPGGYHFMLLGLKQPLTEGDTLFLSLDFEHSGRLDVLAPVRPMGGI